MHWKGAGRDSIVILDAQIMQKAFRGFRFVPRSNCALYLAQCLEGKSKEPVRLAGAALPLFEKHRPRRKFSETLAFPGNRTRPGHIK